MQTIHFKWVPVVDGDLCSGCQGCVLACKPRCLEIVDGIAVLARPDACGSEEHCIAPCPIHAIRMEWVASSGNKNIGTWDTKS